MPVISATPTTSAPDLQAASGSRTQVLLVRHGQTDWNATGLYHGQEDIPLNEVGRSQAVALADALRAEHFDRIVSSPLSRASDTAAAIAALRGLEVIVDDSLLEADAGDWTGLAEPAIFAAHPDYARARIERRDYRLSETGETTLECARRIASGVRRIAERYQGQRILIVGHSYGLQAALGELMGWPLEQSQRVEALFNCALTELAFSSGEWRLISHNVLHAQIPEQRTGEVRIV